MMIRNLMDGTGRLARRSTAFSCLAAVAALTAAWPVGAAEGRPPNIVFVVADDLGYAELGCFGQKKIRTPNIDRLAAGGMRLTQHYAGNAVCAPSRCVLMTGKHPGHAFIRDNRKMKPEGQHPIPDKTVTLAELLQQHGYATGGYGKWGLGGPGSTGVPFQQGFDHFFGYNCQREAHNFYPTYLWDNDRRVELINPIIQKQELPANVDPNDPANYRPFAGKEYSADVIFEQARKFVRDNQDRPFFLFVPTTIPHLALQVPEDSLAEYVGQWDDPPYKGDKGYLPHFAPRAAYAAMVSRMDREVGRIVDLVDELGLAEDTIFVFTSDNGPAAGGRGGTDSDFFDSAGPLRGHKGSLYEGGIRVPTVVSWKGRIAASTKSDHVTGFEDWMPTLLELIGEESTVPDGSDGISFAPTLLGDTQPPRPFLYREFPSYGGQQCARIGDWKGIRQKLKPRGKNAPPPNMHVELYNLGDDVGETTDVSADHPEIVAQITALMRDEHVPSQEFPLPALDEQ